MKNTNYSWRAQKGTKVFYSKYRTSGNAIVIKVLPDDEYLLEDALTHNNITVNQSQIRLNSVKLPSGRKKL